MAVTLRSCERPRIALIHALMHSVEPINAAFKRKWSSAQLMNLLDDSLSADLANNRTGLDKAMHKRFVDLSNYAVDTGAQAILFTCSAFGPCIEEVARAHPGIPVLPPNRAMIEDLTGTDTIVEQSEKIGLLASFAPTLQSMPEEFSDPSRLRLGFVAGALAALDAGDVLTHDALIAKAACEMRDQGCTRIALAQFSMARARDACIASTGLSVYTTVDSAIDGLRRNFTSEPRSSQPPI